MAYIFTDMETFLNTYFFKKKKKAINQNAMSVTLNVLGEEEKG